MIDMVNVMRTVGPLMHVSRPRLPFGSPFREIITACTAVLTRTVDKLALCFTWASPRTVGEHRRCQLTCW